MAFLPAVIPSASSCSDIGRQDAFFERTAKALFGGYKLNAVQEAQAEDRILHGQLGKVIVVLD